MQNSFVENFASDIVNKLQNAAELEERVKFLERQVAALIVHLRDRNTEYNYCNDCGIHTSMINIISRDTIDRVIDVCEYGCNVFICPRCKIEHDRRFHVA